MFFRNKNWSFPKYAVMLLVLIMGALPLSTSASTADYDASPPDPSEIWIDIPEDGHCEEVEIEVINTGTTTWTQADDIVFSYHHEPGDSGSDGDTNSKYYCDGDWPNHHWVAEMKDSSVAPGETAHFDFEFCNPLPEDPVTSDTYPDREHFALAHGGLWFDEDNVKVTVHFRVTHQAKNPNPDSITVDIPQGGRSEPVTIKVEHDGRTTTTWTDDDDVALNYQYEDDDSGSNCDQDGCLDSKFYCEGEWINHHRPVYMQESSVSKGNDATFTFSFCDSDNSPIGSFYTEHFAIAGGSVWMLSSTGRHRVVEVEFNIVPDDTYSISGYVRDTGGDGIAGVEIDFGGDPSAVFTDGDGHYSQSGFANGSYIVTPSKIDCTFDPSSQTVTINDSNESNIDFTATCTQSNSPNIRIEPNSLSFDLSSMSAMMGSQPSTESATTPTPKIVQSDDTSIILDFTVPIIASNEVQVEDETYQQLFLPDEGLTGEIGRPQLPTLGRWVAIPPDASVTVQVLNATTTVLQGYKVYPAQEPLTDQRPVEPDFSPDFSIDTDFYKRDAFYPQRLVALEHPVKWRGTEAVSLRVYPFQYNPKTEELRVYSHVRVKVNFVRDGASASADIRHRSPYFDEVYRDLVLNYDEVLPLAPPPDGITLAADCCDFLIITAPEFETAANTLAAWRNQQGIATQVRTTDETGTTAAAIQSYIQNAYDSWSPAPSFVLLLGDAEFIPPHYETTHPSHNTLVGTDLYYAAVDGTDYFPDIALGRIAIDTATQAEKVISDIINYERNPVPDESFYSHVAVAAYFEDSDRNGYSDRRFVLTSEEIRDYLLTQGYDVRRIYTTEPSIDPTNYNNGCYANGEDLQAELLRANGFAWDGSGTDVSSAVNEGIFILNHRDHGAFGGWSHPRFTASDVSNLTNGNKLPVVFSINCQTGWFDNETDDSSRTSYNDVSFAEAWQRNPNGGAVGVIASTRNSYSGHNDVMVKGFYDAIWPSFLSYAPSGQFSNPQRRMGNVLNYGKLYYATQYSDDKYRKTEFEEFHYFGDPTTQIWTAPPNLTQKTFTIYNDGGADLVVTETIKQNDSCWLDVTAGHPLTIPPGGSEEIVVTVDSDCASAGTHSDRLLVYSNDPDENPYPDGVDVSLIVPSVNEVVHDESNVDSDSGNENGIVNPGETITMNVTLRNLGNDVATDVNVVLTTTSPYVNILDGTLFYSTIGEYGTEGDDGDSVVVEIISDTPGNTVIFFTLEINASNGGPWEDEFAVVVAPDTTPPYIPSSPSPADGASGQPVNISLTWSGGDPDGDQVTYDVYVSTEHPLADLAAEEVGCTDVTTTVCNVDLALGTRYFWYVVATDEHSATVSSPVWSFTTRYKVYLPLVLRNYEPLQPIRADFTASPLTGTAPLTVTFTNESTGPYTSSLWDFGDGFTSTLENPTYTYTDTGTYTVTLTISGASESDDEVKPNYITVYTTPLQAGFTATPTTGTAPLTVTFTNTSTGVYTSSLWHFGDSFTSTVENPTYIYTATGVYTVTLTVSGPGGTSTLSRTNYITVEQGQTDYGLTWVDQSPKGDNNPIRLPIDGEETAWVEFVSSGADDPSTDELVLAVHKGSASTPGPEQAPDSSIFSHTNWLNDYWVSEPTIVRYEGGKPVYRFEIPLAGNGCSVEMEDGGICEGERSYREDFGVMLKGTEEWILTPAEDRALAWFSIYVVSDQPTESNLLILAPHPDDEVLCCTGVISDAVAQGKTPLVVVVTNGDARNPSDHEESLTYGRNRQGETLAALAQLGVPARQVLFLGYPDSELVNLPESGSCTSRYTGKDETYGDYDGSHGGKLDYHTVRFGSPISYSQASLVSDLQQILLDYTPSELYLPIHSSTWLTPDTHLDHDLAGMFLEEALSESGLTADRYYYIVHAPENEHYWPLPGCSTIPSYCNDDLFDDDPEARYTPSELLTPPDGYPEFDVTQEVWDPESKRTLIELYETQINNSNFNHGYMLAFAKQTEGFWSQDYLARYGTPHWETARRDGQALHLDPLPAWFR